ncbi:hypothetical protein EKK70_05505 [Desulfovibrio sp. DS-1]|nr:hypothetical protein EKK70_05505 [Desulfovibrio sp. DS-1]
MADDPFLKLSLSIDTGRLRIQAMPKPDIFLCGGTEDFSARRIFMDKAKVREPDFFSRLVLAEDVISSWFRHDNYDNLLDLEEDLAGLATGIVIFLESAGAIAELGAFVQTKPLAHKTIAVVDPSHNKESFIKLGPLDKLNTLYGDDSVVHYHFSDVNDFYDEIKTDICAKCKPKERKFDHEGFGDISILILELINIAIYAKMSEIQSFITNLGLGINSSKITKSIFMLERIGYISVEMHGKTKYYKSLRRESYIRFSYKEDSQYKEKIYWNYFFINHFKQHDSRRFKLLQSQKEVDNA